MTGLIVAYLVVAATVLVVGIVIWGAFRDIEDERHVTRIGARMVVGCLVWPWLMVVLILAFIRRYATDLLRDSQARMDELMAPVRVTTTCVDKDARVALLNEGYDNKQTKENNAMSGPTKFIEANAILAAQSGDDDAVKEAILKLYPAERRDLRRAAFNLIQALDQYENHAVKEPTDD